MKTKNGQKYVVNERPNGIYVQKSCAILSAIIVLLAIIIAILVTYFLTASTNPDSCSRASLSNQTYAAGIFGGSYGKDDSENGVLADEAMAKSLQKEIKLYEGWNPQLYRVILEPNIQRSIVNGSVSIDITKDSDAKGVPPIILDVKNITIHDAKVFQIRGQQGAHLEISTSYGENNETYIIKITSGLKDETSVNITLELEFTSALSDTLQGFYKASYVDVYSGDPEWFASTQFSPIEARSAFPCFDRPDKKARFSISLVRGHDKRMTLSNMPSLRTSLHRPGFVQEDFDTTPKMSTYLVAFMTSNLMKSNVSDADRNMVPRVDIWTRPEVTDMTQYAYALTRKILPFYESYYGIPFKLPKIDLVAVPDFGFSAMENWGLITFRDSAILVPEGEDQSSSAAHTEYVALILAHELAHQWFGNLVTPKWWDELWLKEGFATFMSYHAVNTFEPQWNLMEKFGLNEFHHSMEKDSDKSSHPISFPVTSVTDIRRIFDPISYSKGAILIRMLNSFLGDESFNHAIKDYLKQFAYSNAVQDDLWKLMTKYGNHYGTLPPNMTTKEIMDSWTLQAGYPVVHVERSGQHLMLKQERYLLPKRDLKDNTKWFIPISFETKEMHAVNDLPTHWLTKDNDNIIIPNVFSNTENQENWVYLNVKRHGYYRVNYDYSSWIALKKSFSQLPQIARAQLLDDSLNLARAEYLTYDVPLTFILEMHTYVEDQLLWKSAFEGLKYITYMLSREPAFESFRALMKYVIRPAFDHYSLNEREGTDHVTLMHQAHVVKLACQFQYDRCTNQAQLKYREWMRDPKNNLIKPNLKETIYCTALQQGSFHEWYFAYNRYKEITSASEKEQILSSLGCTIKPWLLSKYLNMTIDPQSGIRKQDGARAFTAVARNNIGYEIAFDFLMTNIQEISEYFGDGFSTLTKMIDAITTYMNRDYHMEQLQKFALKARKLGLKSVERAILLATEQVSNNIHWRKRSYPNLKNFLEVIVKDFHINLY